MKKIEHFGKRLAELLLVAALGLTAAACSSQGESSSSQMESSQGSAVSTASEALESRESLDQGNSTSSSSPLAESASSQKQQEGASVENSSQSQGGETSQPQEQQGVTPEDFSSSEGDFTYLELEYGTPAQVVLPLFGLSGGEPDREWESYGGGMHQEYDIGTVDLEDHSFLLKLKFQDDQLNEFSFTCDAQEGEDLTSLYEDLRTKLKDLYGLKNEQTIQGTTVVLGGSADGQTLSYDSQRYSTVREEEGERSTRLSLSLMESGGAGVQVELSLGLYQ